MLQELCVCFHFLVTCCSLLLPGMKLKAVKRKAMQQCFPVPAASYPGAVAAWFPLLVLSNMMMTLGNGRKNVKKKNHSMKRAKPSRSVALPTPADDVPGVHQHGQQLISLPSPSASASDVAALCSSSPAVVDTGLASEQFVGQPVQDDPRVHPDRFAKALDFKLADFLPFSWVPRRHVKKLC